MRKHVVSPSFQQSPSYRNHISCEKEHTQYQDLLITHKTKTSKPYKRNRQYGFLADWVIVPFNSLCSLLLNPENNFCNVKVPKWTYELLLGNMHATTCHHCLIFHYSSKVCRHYDQNRIFPEKFEFREFISTNLNIDGVPCSHFPTSLNPVKIIWNQNTLKKTFKKEKMVFKILFWFSE